MAKIYPSLISADLLNLEATIKSMEPFCAGFHLDVMDFHFVPNLTFGPTMVNAVRTATSKTVWVDLLVEEPEKYLDRLKLSPGDIVSIHIESTHSPDIFKSIRNRGWLASLAIDPHSEINRATSLIAEVDHVLIMSVIPGFSGQEFIPDSIKRLKELHAFLAHLKHKPLIGMDGGLNEKTLPEILSIGVDTVAMASALFSKPNPVEALKFWATQ